MNTKCIGMVVVPQSLRLTLFDNFHAGHSGGHMETHKTLFCLRIRFYWPFMWEDVNIWISRCAHRVAYNVWRTRQSELYFTWPTTAPFWIMHVDLW